MRPKTGGSRPRVPPFGGAMLTLLRLPALTGDRSLGLADCRERCG
jgi:hypothetical protein